MYPKISDAINDLLGTNIDLPIQSYGFFVALAFITGGYIFYLELKRKEMQGLLQVSTKTIIKGKGATFQELFWAFIVSFIIGFKLIGIFLDYSMFSTDPQYFLFSMEGNLWGGLILGGAFTYWTYYSKNKEKKDTPIKEEVEIHPYQLTGNFILIAAISGIIGAKIFHQLENMDEFLADPVGSLLSFSGLTFYGGLIVAAVVLSYYSEKNKISWVHLGDSVAPALLIAYAIGRIGCHVAGDGDWGIVNEMPKPEWLTFLPDWMWAYDYPHNVLKTGIPIEGCTGEYCYKLPQPVFPTPVYETITCTLLFLVLWLLRKRIMVPGYIFSLYLIFNGFERFWIEKIRVNETYAILGSEITQAEIISFVLVLLGIAGFIFFNKRHKKAQKV